MDYSLKNKIKNNGKNQSKKNGDVPIGTIDLSQNKKQEHHINKSLFTS